MAPSFKGELFIGVPSLRCAPERREYMEGGMKEQWGGLSICGVDVHFHEVDLDPDGGKYGCSRSHLACYQKALDAGCRALLLFEDDIKPNKHFTERMVELCMEKIKDWDIIRLHRTGLCKIHGDLGDGFYHTSSLSGEAYFISESLMRECLRAQKENEEDVIPYTKHIAKVCGRMVTYQPTPITEGIFGSYNTHWGSAPDPILKFIQWSFNYTTAVQTLLSVHLWWTNQGSPMCTPETFPYSGTMNCSYRKEKMKPIDWVNKGGQYIELGTCPWMCNRRRIQPSKKTD